MQEYEDKIMSLGYYSWYYLSKPQNNIILFVDELNRKLKLKTTKVYLINDININILSNYNANYASDYVNYAR